MRDLNREREVLAQLYSNNADVIKYFPFFFKDRKQLENFFDYFGGKTIKVPNSYREFLEQLLVPNTLIQDNKRKGINCSEKLRKRMLESYIKLFNSLEELIQIETTWDGDK